MGEKKVLEVTKDKYGKVTGKILTKIENNNITWLKYNGKFYVSDKFKAIRIDNLITKRIDAETLKEKLQPISIDSFCNRYYTAEIQRSNVLESLAEKKEKVAITKYEDITIKDNNTKRDYNLIVTNNGKVFFVESDLFKLMESYFDYYFNDDILICFDGNGILFIQAAYYPTDFLDVLKNNKIIGGTI